jgi:hypothetical protein
MNTREEIYHMTAKEMARLIVRGKTIEKTVIVKEASVVSKLSTRQMLFL